MNRAALVASVTGVACIAVMLVTLTRAPLVWVDEVYFVSAARDVAAGGRGTPDIEPASDVSFPFMFLHGPVFFWLEGQIVSRFGASPVTGRAVSFAGALLAGVAAAGLVLVLTGSAAWAAIAFAALMLSPEIGSSAPNARMDTLALSLELAGMAAFVSAAGRTSRAIPLGLLAGAIWGTAMLTTARTFPFAAAVAAIAAAALVIGRPFDRRTLLIVCAAVAVAGVAVISLWTYRWQLSPIAWAWRVVGASSTNDMISLGLRKKWAVSVPNVLTSVVVFPLAAIVLRSRTALGTRAGYSRFVLACGVCAAVLYIAPGNDVFLRSIHFAILPILGVIGLGSALEDGTGPRLFVAVGVAGLLLFAGLRAVRTADVVETWNARSPHAFDRLVADHVPAGSVVVGYDEFYYYAVVNAGATFRSYRVDPWAYETGRLRTVWADAIHRSRVMDAKPDFLIWPDDEHWPMPPSLHCATAAPIARYDAPQIASILDRVPFLTSLAYLRRYPSTTLYRVPIGCEV